MLDTGYWILDTGYWILDTGYWILDTHIWILDTDIKITSIKSNVPTFRKIKHLCFALTTQTPKIIREIRLN